MNPIRTIRRLACTLTGLAVTLAAAVALAPAAFAGTRVHPATVPPAELVRFGPLAHAFSGGSTGTRPGRCRSPPVTRERSRAPVHFTHRTPNT